MAAHCTVSILGQFGKSRFQVPTAFIHQDNSIHQPLDNIIKQAHNNPVALPLVIGDGILTSHQVEDKESTSTRDNSAISQ